MRRVQDRYADIVTRRAWPELHDLMRPDCRLSLDLGDRTLGYDGPQAIGDFIGEQLEAFSFFEFVILNTVVEVDLYAGVARARMFMQELRQNVSDGRRTNAFGVYHDRFDQTPTAGGGSPPAATTRSPYRQSTVPSTSRSSSPCRTSPSATSSHRRQVDLDDRPPQVGPTGAERRAPSPRPPCSLTRPSEIRALVPVTTSLVPPPPVAVSYERGSSWTNSATPPETTRATTRTTEVAPRRSPHGSRSQRVTRAHQNRTPGISSGSSTPARERNARGVSSTAAGEQDRPAAGRQGREQGRRRDEEPERRSLEETFEARLVAALGHEAHDADDRAGNSHEDHPNDPWGSPSIRSGGVQGGDGAASGCDTVFAMAISQDHRMSETATRLVEATRACIAEGGIPAATSREIAAAAGTNLQAITYHFGFKDRLVARALVETVREWVGPALDVMREPGDPATQMLAGAQALTAHFEQRRAQAPVLLEALVATPPARAAHRRARPVGRAAHRLAGHIAAC